MKYICLKNEDTGAEEIIIFPGTIHHDCAAEAFAFVRNKTHGDWRRESRIAVSAGFVNYSIDGLPHCYGKSESLRIASRPEDTAILRAQLH